MSSKKHGLYKSRLNSILRNMKQRCYNHKNPRYNVYGGKGIKICDEWMDKENGLVNFYNWAINNGYQDNLTIDRINNDKDYCPENCRWITNQEQQYNKSVNHLITYNGKTMCIAEWSNELGITSKLISTRLSKGWSVERTFTTPMQKQQHNVKFTYNGETHSLGEWSIITNIKYSTLKYRLYMGWSIEETLTTPIGGGYRHENNNK